MLAPNLDAAQPLEIAAADYEIVRRAVEYVNLRFRDQPEVEEIARAAGVPPRALTELFRRWCGLTPKDFLQAVTIDAARRVLSQSDNVLDAAYELGLSGPGRLHDLFVVHESMSPGEWKTGGAGLVIRYGFHASQFGKALAMVAPRGLCGLAFADEGEEEPALADMRRRWPNAIYIEDPLATAPYAARIFDARAWSANDPLRIVFIGTDFEVQVWETLMRIPMGKATTYSSIAGCVERPKAARAVGAAVGKNPISFVVPCHRVIGKNGDLTGYHWGLTRKRAILGWEAGRLCKAWGGL
ncbi:bifunctional helix-turn-helix domain-containing protein/methylated-DNA--[protein]-cysteine S-methyltransferase [Ancylobacter amanitiformis]|uniref:AraC family transcriptional regulator of adaptative response/methylated-DNA-[protein]-cysteine methyltransferase n=1 Tax=Ancylobacter amanitiformis TaxID=217069 RepID=A0ABU0LVG7_9HYPH|nr:bifunctional helix-turn-helix domain-containing protein/methylated-DNA--[protein]-cysteine S-methyltransferase [Ancylobacter amanitiformis]MDQ0512660.1 AraC family transcriptional regulator of adaptative response/methylated-DNA-[protein]-cysteine methyltransferase [Ancylobacter amanitiformis]